MSTPTTVASTTTAEERALRGDAMLILKGAGWYGIATGVGMLLEYGFQALLAVELGPAEFGLFRVALQLFSFSLLLATLAFPSAVAHFVARLRAEGRVEESARLLATALVVALAASGVIGVLLVVAAPLLSERLFDAPGLLPVVRALALALPPSAALLVTVGILRGQTMSREASLLTTTYERALRLGLTVVLLVAGLGVLAPALAYLPAAALVLGLGIRTLRRAPIPLRPIPPRLSESRRLLAYAWPLLLSQLLIELKRGTQPLLLAFFLDTRATGLFAVAHLISGAFSMVLVALNFLYLPVISAISPDESAPRIRRLYRMVTTWGITVVLPPVLVLFLFPATFLSFFGPEYGEGAWALRLLAISALTNVGTGAVGTTLLATGRTMTYLTINAIGIGIGTVISLMLVPSFGLIGAAAGHVITGILWNGATLLVVNRLYGLQPFGRHTLNIALVALVALLPFYPLFRWTAGISVVLFLALVLVYAALTVALLLVFRLLDADSLTSAEHVRARVSERLHTAWRHARGGQ